MAGPRTVAGEEERSEQGYNGFGQVELTRRRLVGRWLETPTSYDAAGNAVATSTLTGTNEVLTANYRYDALGRVAAQTTDPTNPGHKVAFTYDAEGAQLTRVDSRQTAGPATGACGEAGVSCQTLRTTTNAYNNDTTVRSSVSTDSAGQSLATCDDDGSGPASGYDADKHPLAVRTLTATTTCSGGRTEREVTMSYDSRGLLSAMTQNVRGDSGLVARSQSFEHRPDTTVSSATHAGRTTTYGRSPAGWSESISADREPGSPKASTFSYSPAGAPTGSSLGSGTATSTRTYAPDGMVASLVWSAAGTTVRSHTNLAYDVGGLRTAEAVAVVHPATATGTDPGGPAADGAGLSLARYVVDGAEPVAQHTFRRILGGGKDPTDTAGTWAWLLDDPAGNVATTVGDNGAVLSQAAFDPYGVPEATGKSKAPGPDAKTSLGFQSALTDPTTDKVILGPRQYDPKTARFTNPDVFVGGGADLALGTDPLTGNRYLFAGANPVANYEDGHGSTAKRNTPRQLPPKLDSALYEVCIRGINGNSSLEVLKSDLCHRYRRARVTGRAEFFYGKAPIEAISLESSKESASLQAPPQ